MNLLPLGQLIASAPTRRAGDQQLPILSMTMHGGLVDQASKFKKRIASDDTSTYKVVKRGQLVVGFPIDEGVLDFQSLHDEAIVSPAYGIWDLRDESRVDPKYLSRYLRSPGALAFYRSKLRATTARRRSLPAELFLGLPVPLPPLDEQRRVAAILETVDQSVDLCRAGISLLAELPQALFQQMFADRADSDDEVVSLGDAVAPGTIVTYGIVQAGPEFIGGVPYIRTGDLVDGRIAVASMRRTDPAIASKFARSRVSQNDIVMSIRATVGTTAMVPAELDGANLTQGTARISPGPDFVPEFLLESLRSPRVQRWIQAQVKGATFREITLSRLRELPLQRPPMALQKEFEGILRSVARQRARAEQRLEQAQLLSNSLRQRAFSGRL